jgi:hypothetical protein
MSVHKIQSSLRILIVKDTVFQEHSSLVSVETTLERQGGVSQRIRVRVILWGSLKYKVKEKK